MSDTAGVARAGLYSAAKETGESRSASREAEGPGPATPRQPARSSVVPIPGRMPSEGRKEMM
jgi:hypothetical protein